MKTYIISIIFVIILSVTIACRQTFYFDVTNNSSFSHIELLASDICFGSIFRSNLYPDPAVPERTGILAGFRTAWYPGAPPFACDRLQKYITKGAFRFNLSSIDERRFYGARIEITGFEPNEGSIRIEDANTWGCNLCGFTPGLIINSTRFELQAITVPWDSSLPSVNNDIPSTGLWLTTPNNNFVAPLTGTRSIDVSHEISSMLNNRGNVYGFAIVPNDPSMDKKSNNVAYGRFRVRLVVQYY
jgi:hypothetical protein